MCGIAGIVAIDGFDPATLVGMTQLIHYRGPDAFGFAYGGLGAGAPMEIVHNQTDLPSSPRPVVGLGNRRLAILDVSSAGNQPMQIAEGSCTITFNGEVYNYKEIRKELELAGHQFHTQTDTEVILHSYQEWGEACVSRFNGMWAFAIWDSARQKLFCSRDRFGVKPFYYAVYAGKFYLASEIKQILQASAMLRRANPRTTFQFLEWGLLDNSNETFFEGIYQLPGGHSLTLAPARELTPQIRRYWELQTEPAETLSDGESVERFRELFDNALTIRLRSDVPVGVALSGGLDSSSILCKAREIAPDARFETFSACFEDAPIDEREFIAEAVNAARGVGRRTFPQARSFWDAVKTVIYHQDEPIGSPAAFPQWCVMQEARQHNVPVILGGQGGDEALCGYQKYYIFYLRHLLGHVDPRFFREFYLWSRRSTSSYLTFGAVSRYLPALFRGPFSLTNKMGTPELLQTSGETRSSIGYASSIAERQKTDLISSSIPALLHHEDRNSMAHSVESRLPFLDYRLVEFALRCPVSMKLRDGWSKWLLRSAMAETLPPKIRLRKTKLGFNTPETRWMQLGLCNGHRELWEKPDLRMQRFMDPAKFKMVCERFVNQAHGALPSSSLFRAISLELWAQVYSVS